MDDCQFDVPSVSERSACRSAVSANQFLAESAGEFQLMANEGAQRRDLSQRQEFKYMVNQEQVPVLRQVLDACFVRQVHDQPVSTVRSLYWDEPGYPACHANLQGLGSRRKVRLRWYDTAKPGPDFYFEVKWRENTITGKHRIRLNARRPLCEYPFKKIQNELSRVLPEYLVGYLARPLEPMVIVEYRREHFVAQDLDLRLTLDYGLRFYDQSGRQHWRFDFGIARPDLALVECKMASAHVSMATTLLSKIPLRIQSCSKYVKGCQTLGLVNG